MTETGIKKREGNAFPNQFPVLFPAVKPTAAGKALSVHPQSFPDFFRANTPSILRGVPKLPRSFFESFPGFAVFSPSTSRKRRIRRLERPSRPSNSVSACVKRWRKRSSDSSYRPISWRTSANKRMTSPLFFSNVHVRKPMRKLVSKAAKVAGPDTSTRYFVWIFSISPSRRAASAYRLSAGRNITA